MSERLLITDRALMTLRSIVQVSMLINVFLLANEVFKEFYSGNLHVVSSKYLFVGLDIITRWCRGFGRPSRSTWWPWCCWCCPSAAA
jgi:hypothetical protein